jgi:hypothetical protein
MKAMILLPIAALSLAALGSSLNAQTYSFQVLEECEGNAPLPQAINNNGTVVGEAHALNSVYSLGFVYSGGSCTTYSLDGQGASFLGVTNSNQIIGIVAPDQNYLEQNGAFHGLAPYPSAYSTYYCCLSKTGVLAGNYYPTASDSYGTGFFYSNSTFSALPPENTGPYTIYRTIYGLNEAGVAVGTQYGFYGSGFIVKDGKITYLQYPGAKYTSFNGINDNGVVVGSYVLEGSQASNMFLYDTKTGTWTDLNFAYPYNDSQPVGINNAGVIAAEYMPSGGLLIITPQ